MQSALATHWTHLPALQTGVVPVQSCEVVAVPAALQMTTLLPLQLVAPGVQTWFGTQVPARQVPPVQGLLSGALLVAQPPLCAEQALTRHWPGAGQLTGAPA